MIRINLLPERRRRRRLVPESGVISVLLLVIAALVGSYFHGAYQNRLIQAQTGEINRKTAEIRPKVAEVLALEVKMEDLRAREELLRTLEARQVPWAEMLTDLAQRTPQDAWLAGASVTDTKGAARLTLTGSAMSYNAVARFMTNLAASRFYSDVDLQGAHGTKLASAQIVQFGLLTTLRPVLAVPAGGAR